MQILSLFTYFSFYLTFQENLFNSRNPILVLDDFLTTIFFIRRGKKEEENNCSIVVVVEEVRNRRHGTLWFQGTTYVRTYLGISFLACGSTELR